MLLAAGCAAGSYIAFRALSGKFNADDGEWSSSTAHEASTSDRSGPSASQAVEQQASPARDHSKLLRDGALVCLTDQYGGHMVVQQVGKHWELTATTSLPVLTFSDGGVVLCHQPYDSLFVVVKKRDGGVVLRSVGADGRALQAQRDKGAPHRVLSHQGNGAELWRCTPNGLVNAHYRHKKLGFAVNEVHAVTLDALRGLDNKYAGRMQEFRNQVDCVQRQVAESARRAQELEHAAGNAAADHNRKVDQLNSQLQRALESLNGSEEQKLRQSSTVLQLEQRIGMLSSEKQEVDEQLGQAHAKIAHLQQELLNTQDRHVMEKRKLAHDLESKLESVHRRKDQQLQEMQASVDAVRRSMQQLEKETRQKEHVRASLAQSLAVRDAELQHLTTQCQRLEYALKTIHKQIAAASAPPPRLDRASLDAVSLQELRDAVERMKAGNAMPYGAARASGSLEVWQLLHGDQDAQPQGKQQQGQQQDDKQRRRQEQQEQQQAQQDWGKSSAWGARSGSGSGEASRDVRTPSPSEVPNPQLLQLNHAGAAHAQEGDAAAAALQLSSKLCGSDTLQQLLRSAGVQSKAYTEYLEGSSSQASGQNRFLDGKQAQQAAGGPGSGRMRDSAASMASRAAASRRRSAVQALQVQDKGSPVDTCNSCTADTSPRAQLGRPQHSGSRSGSLRGSLLGDDDTQGQHRYSYSDDSDCGSCTEGAEVVEALQSGDDELEPGLEGFAAAQQSAQASSSDSRGSSSGRGGHRQTSQQQHQQQQQQSSVGSGVRGASGAGVRVPPLSPVKEEDERANSNSPRRPRKHVAFQLEPEQHAPPSGTSSSYDPSPIRFCIADAVAAMHTASPTRAAALANCVADAMTAQHVLMARNGQRPQHSPHNGAYRDSSPPPKGGYLKPQPAESPSPIKSHWAARGSSMGDAALRTAMERDRLCDFISRRPARQQGWLHDDC